MHAVVFEFCRQHTWANFLMPDSPLFECFSTSDGYPCAYRRYRPRGTPRGIVVYLNGIQSHGGWYEYSCTRMQEAGYEVLFLDRRGSGLNQIERGHVVSFERLLADVAEFVTAQAPRRPGRKVVLQAVSWGGKIAVALQKTNPDLVDGLVLLCPGFFPTVSVDLQTKWQIFFASMTSPQVLFPIPLSDPALFTGSAHWQGYIRTDSHTLHYASARFFVQSARLDHYCRGIGRHVQVPTLMLLAGKDRIIRNDRTQRFFHQMASAHKNVITYGDAEHTLEFEPEPHWFVDEILRWLDRQCLPGPRTVL